MVGNELNRKDVVCLIKSFEIWRCEVKLLASNSIKGGFHKAGNFPKQEHQEILSSKKTGHDKYSKEIIGPYADLFLYVLKRHFIISIIRLFIIKKILVKKHKDTF